MCGPSREEVGWKGCPGASPLNAESQKLAPMQSPDSVEEDVKEYVGYCIQAVSDIMLG